MFLFFFFSSRRRHTRLQGDWSSDVCSSDLGTFFDRLPHGDVDRLDHPRPRRAQLVLHFHRLDDHETGPRIHPLPFRYLDPHHQAGHRRAYRASAARPLALAARRLDPAAAFVLHRHFHPLAHQPQRPPAGTLERLGGYGPRRSTEQQVIEGRSRYGGEVGLEHHPIHGYTIPFYLDLEGLGADGHEVLHRTVPPTPLFFTPPPSLPPSPPAPSGGRDRTPARP